MAKSTNQEEEEDIDALRKQFQSLEQDWNSYKKSIPRHRHARSTAGTLKAENITETLISALLENSPKKLISSLQQQCGSPFFDRRGEVEGKNLLEELEMARDDNDDEDGGSSNCSVYSSVLIQEASSSCSCCSRPSSSSYHSSSSSSSVESSDRGVDEKKVTTNQEKGMVGMRRVFLGVLMVALGIIFAALSFGGRDEYGKYITPT